MKWLHAVVFLTGTCLSSLTLAAVESEQVTLKPLRDLDFGHSLYYQFQQEYFPAIIHLTVAQEKETIPHHQQDAELLLGGMYLSFGMHEEAGKLFERLINDDLPERVRNRAWYYLAKIRYQRGLYQQAEQAITKITNELDGGLEGQRLLLQANILMAQQRYADADTYLSALSNQSIWAVYARYNLGVSLIKQNQVVRGQEILTEIGARLAPDTEMQALRDQANLALGYSHIQLQQPEAAIEQLRKVRLRGHLSNKALLGLGWAYEQQEQYERALVPWLELNKRNILDSAVQESLLAIPYALSKLDQDRIALKHYQTAIEVYSNEIQRLQDTIININNGSFINDILSKQSNNEMGWFWEMEKAPDAAESQYLIALLASHQFQESLKNYRDLRILKANLLDWQNNIEIFDTILDTRRNAYNERLPEIQQKIDTSKAAYLTSKRDSFVAGLEHTERTDDLLALASNKEKKQLARIQQARQRLDRLPVNSKTVAATEKIKLLEGVIKWNIASDFTPRMRAARKQLVQLDKALAEHQQRSESMQKTQQQAPLRFEGYGSRIKGQSETINELLTRIGQAEKSQQQYLETLAIAELRAQQKRIDSYLAHAQFSLAQLQDKASQTLEDEAP